MDSSFGTLLLIPIVAGFAYVMQARLPDRVKLYCSVAAWFSALLLAVLNPDTIYPLLILSLITFSLIIRLLRERQVLRSKYWALFHL